MKPASKISMMRAPPFIPNEIVDQILLRLPANSLLRLRWACKYWFNLISIDPEFLKKYLHNLDGSNIFNNDVCVLMSDYSGDLYKRYFNSITCKASPKVRLDFPFEESSTCNSFRMLSSCNGLIFFSHSITSRTTLVRSTILCIWNPFTKEYKVLPNPIKRIRYYDDNVTYGFGYDHTINDYKVIRNAYSKDIVETDIQVYILRTNSWRRIGVIPKTICPTYLRNNGVFVNGAIYWITCGRLISFDLEKEEYQEVPIEMMCPHYWKLGVFEGSLCRLPGEEDICEEMWVMNKETYSWSKVCRMPKFPVMKPLRFNKNGDILMVGGSPSDFVLFNPKKNEVLKKFYIYQGQLLCSVKEVYIESIVSLNSGTYVGDNWKKPETKCM